MNFQRTNKKPLLCIGFISTSLGLFLSEVLVSAQIVPDNTLGVHSSQLDGNIIRRGEKRGENLFHSFREFSIGEGQSFKFSNHPGVTRIFSRVTGNKPSEIRGTLGVLGNADLFLINPRGIIFGPNARLDLKGSFIGTTADSVVFADGIFGASNRESSTILSVNVPLGLQINATVGQILNQSVAINKGITFVEGQSPDFDKYLRETPTGLLVGATDKTLALIGGDILFENGAKVTNFDGHIELGSVGEGEVTLNPSSSGWSFSYEKVARFGDVKFSQRSKLQPFPLENLTTTQIQARRINFSGLEGGVFSVNSAAAEEPIAGGLTKLIATESIELDDGTVLINATVNLGEAGNIVIESPKFRLDNNSMIVANSTGVGDPDNPSQVPGGKSGSVIINAPELVEINHGSLIDATSILTTEGGNIEIQSNSITLDNQSTITTNSELGNGGNISLNAANLLTLRRGSKISTNSGGSGGNIDIKARFILASPSEDSNITANALLGTGGNINIEALGIVGIEKRDKGSPLTSDITASSERGVAGIVNINNTEIEPKQNVQELPDEPLDVAQLIDQSLCSVGKGSELTITGRGGLPNSSQQALQENNLWEDWRIVEKTPKNTQVTPPSTLETQTQTTPREFQGWTVNARGNVVLTAQPIIVTPQGDWLPPLGCQHLRAENQQI